jgi:uncharacterized protein
MQIGILSDSHDNRPSMARAAALFRAAGCGLVIHAGDFVAPFAARELEKAGCPVRAVFGNCDGERGGLEAALAGFGIIQKAPFGFAWAGLEFLVTHLDAPVLSYINKKKYDVIVYGHTHNPEVRVVGRATRETPDARSAGGTSSRELRGAQAQESRTLVINPGETGGWLTGRSTVALLDTETKSAEIVGI